MKKILVDGDSLGIEDVVMVSRYKREVELPREVIDRLDESRRFVEEIIRRGKPVYGVNTGVGELCNTRIEKDKLTELQKNIIYSHAILTPPYLSKESTRGTMLLRANSLAKGYSGVRKEIIERLLFFLNNDVIPIIPEKGSLGASGDLIPLAVLALFLMGEGRGFYKGREMESKEIHRKLGIEPIKYEEKEALSMINGTSFSLSISILSLYDAKVALKGAIISAGLSAEALLSLSSEFHEKIQEAKPYPEQKVIAHALRRFLDGSELIDSNLNKVQDAYVIRCLPQIYGSIYSTLKYAERIYTVEANSSSDNPLVFPKEELVLSGGNFHGSFIATADDYLSISMTILGNNSERRLNRLLNSSLSENLPPFLIKNSGLNTGFMLLQYLSASLVSENKVLSTPASINSIPVSADQEDDVSMSATSARKLRQIVDNVLTIISIEILSATQALYFRKRKRGRGTEKALSVLRDVVPFIEKDTNLSLYIEKIRNLLTSETLIKEVEKEIGEIL